MPFSPRLQKPTVQKILQMAELVFSEKGFTAARVDDIAERAGIAKSHLYYHFGSKEALLSDLVEWRTAQILEEKEALLSGVTELTPEVTQHVVSHFLLSLMTRHRNFIRVVLLESIASQEGNSALFQIVQLLLGDTAQRFRALGYEFKEDNFVNTLYYFGLLPIAFQIATGAQWAAANNIPSQQHDEWFQQALIRLERLFVEQLRKGGGKE